MNQYDILQGDISTDFCNLTKAKYLIISNSSFSYFPINLEEKPKMVIAPLYWSRFGNKYNRWASPANCYEDFCWQDSKGKLISKFDTQNSLLSTVHEFKNYNIRSKIGPAKSNNKIIYILKKSIKYILNKFFQQYFKNLNKKMNYKINNIEEIIISNNLCIKGNTKGLTKSWPKSYIKKFYSKNIFFKIHL